MDYTIGTVVSIENRATMKVMVIKLSNDKYELFFSNLRGYPKSLKVGNDCKVFFKHGIMGMISYKATKL